MLITKVLQNGYKVITESERGALGCKNLSKTITKVFNPKGDLVVAREKGIFRNWDSGSTLMNLPKGINGTYVQKETEVLTPNILNVSSSYNRIKMSQDVFRPNNAGNCSFHSGSIIDKNGQIATSTLRYNEPWETMINQEKHSIVEALVNKVFGK